MIAMLLLAACTSHGKKIYCPTAEMCSGIVGASCIVGDPPKRHYLVAPIVRAILKTDDCSTNSHLHPLGGAGIYAEPDVKNGPLYQPDGDCHDDHSDKVVP